MSESKFFPDQFKSDRRKTHGNDIDQVVSAMACFRQSEKGCRRRNGALQTKRLDIGLPRLWPSLCIAISSEFGFRCEHSLSTALQATSVYSSCRASGVDDSAKQFCSSVRKRTRVPTLINIAQSSTRQKATLPPDPSNKASGEDAR
jgi:hypothetical protein